MDRCDYCSYRNSWDCGDGWNRTNNYDLCKYFELELQYLIEDRDRHELDRANTKKLKEQILRLGASMCADVISQNEQYKKGFEDAKRVFLVKYIRESENIRKRNAQLEVMLNAQKAILAEVTQVNDNLINKQDTINAIENTDVKLTKKDWDELMDAINALPSIEAAQKWIPIEEQLPENGFDDVVLVSIGYDVEFGRCNSNGEWQIWSNSEWIQCDKVLAWMPLPEPYKGGENK